MLVVACVLSAVVAITHGGWLELVGALAVLLSFGHAQVADRLAETSAWLGSTQSHPKMSYVECHRWATRYLVSKESCWLIYFVLHRSWSALAGVGLFLAYTPWRRFWRSRHPL